MDNELTLLTFLLDQVRYGINAHELQEVVPLPELTPLADAPPFASGIFNLRGRIVTAIDLRQRMGLRLRVPDLKNVALVVPFERRLYGLIVDEALSLITVPGEHIEPARDLSPFAASSQSTFVCMVAKLEGHLILVLNLKPILAIAETQQVDDSR